MKPTRDRPFVRAHFSRQLRKLMVYHYQGKRLQEAEYDQLMAKVRSSDCLNVLCDLFDSDEDYSWKTLNAWASKSWDVIREIAAGFADLPLDRPELYYNVGAQGRRARRAIGPRYQMDIEFLADKEAFEKEMNEEA